jgi:hypothetical protein
LLRAWQRAGNDGSDIALIPSGTKTMMVAAANDRIADAWEWADWPELCRVEERTVQGNATSGYYLDYVQAGETEMGEIFNVYRDNPATHVAPREIGYTLLGDSIRFPDDDSIPTDVWVRFRIRPVDHVERVTAVGMTAALLETVPAVIAKAVDYMLTADLLDEDGQTDKAMLNEQRGENELIKERDKYYFQQNQPTRWTARVNQY